MAVELARTCDDDKCRDVTILDLRGLCSMADYFVIATGTSQRQIRTVADHLVQRAAQFGWRPLGIEGAQYSHWVLIDLVDVVVHVFAPSYRELYDLELLWGDASRVPWERGEVTRSDD